MASYKDASDVDLRAPEICSSLHLAKEIKEVRNMKPKPAINDMVKHYNVNFMPNEKIYHDLIDIDYFTTNKNFTVKKKSQAMYRSTIKKDPAPDFKSLLSYKLEPEHCFTKLVKPQPQKNIEDFDGHSIYKRYKVNRICADDWTAS